LPVVAGNRIAFCNRNNRLRACHPLEEPPPLPQPFPKLRWCLALDFIWPELEQLPREAQFFPRERRLGFHGGMDAAFCALVICQEEGGECGIVWRRRWYWRFYVLVCVTVIACLRCGHHCFFRRCSGSNRFSVRFHGACAGTPAGCAHSLGFALHRGVFVRQLIPPDRAWDCVGWMDVVGASAMSLGMGGDHDADCCDDVRVVVFGWVVSGLFGSVSLARCLVIATPPLDFRRPSHTALFPRRCGAKTVMRPATETGRTCLRLTPAPDQSRRSSSLPSRSGPSSP
jgi:hypothetical protein